MFKNNRASLHATSSFCIISYPLVNSNLSYSPETPNLGQMRIFRTLKFDGWPWKTITSSIQALCSILYWWIQTGVKSGNAQLGHSTLFSRVTLKRMTFKNNRAPLLCYFKLCAAFHSHWWIQTGVTAGNAGSNSAKRRVTLKFDGVGHLS